MRYDEFVVEQLAGDLLPNATVSQRIATGFLRNNRSVTEAGSIEEEWHIENIIDRVEHHVGRDARADDGLRTMPRS